MYNYLNTLVVSLVSANNAHCFAVVRYSLITAFRYLDSGQKRSDLFTC